MVRVLVVSLSYTLEQLVNFFWRDPFCYDSDIGHFSEDDVFVQRSGKLLFEVLPRERERERDRRKLMAWSYIHPLKLPRPFSVQSDGEESGSRK